MMIFETSKYRRSCDQLLLANKPDSTAAEWCVAVRMVRARQPPEGAGQTLRVESGHEGHIPQSRGDGLGNGYDRKGAAENKPPPPPHHRIGTGFLTAE